MRIALDVDGVIADFIWGFTQVATELGVMTGRFRTSDQQEWNFPCDMNAVWEEVKGRWNWWMTLEPITTADEITALNKAIGEHDVYFITSRPRTRGLSAERQTHHWLTSIGLHAAHATVIATKAGSKGVLCKALDIEVVLEDCPANLEDLWRHGVGAYARAQPYNRDWSCRVENVREFLEEIT